MSEKFKTQDSYKQRIERDQSLVDRQKNDLRGSCEKVVAQMLHTLGCDDVKILKSEVNTEYDGHFLQGSVKISCGIYKGKQSTVEIVATVTDGVIQLPKHEAVEALFPVIAEKKSNTVESIANIPQTSLVKESEAHLISEQKNNMITMAEANIIALLRPMYGTVKIWKLSEANFKLDENKNFNGIVSIYTEICDKYGSKKVKIPVAFKESKFTPPSVKILEAEIAKTSTVAEIFEKGLDEEARERIRKIDEDEAYKESETLKSLELGPSVANLKVASTNNTPEVYIAKTLKINKSIFPDSIKKGDVVDVDGKKYTISDDSDGKVSEVGTGSIFTLTLLENSDEDAEVKIGS